VGELDGAVAGTGGGGDTAARSGGAWGPGCVSGVERVCTPS